MDRDTNRRRNMTITLAAALAAAAAPGAALADSRLPDFRLAVVGPVAEGEQLEASAIDAEGRVAATLTNATGHHAVVWSPAHGLRRIGALPGSGGQSYGAALDDAGGVAGSSGTAKDKRAFVRTPEAGMIDLDALLPPDLVSRAVAINDAGDVVVTARGHQHLGVFPASRSFVWSAAQGVVEIADIPGGYAHVAAHGINALGHVTGYSDTGFGYGSAFVWRRESGTQALGVPQGWYNGTVGAAINSSDTVVGFSTVGCCVGAVMWTPADGWRAMGGIPNLFGYSEATAINEAGDVAGISARGENEHNLAVLWPRGGHVVDLNQHIDPADPLAGRVLLTAARGINDRGQILVSALVDGLPQALVMTPAH